MVYYHDESLQKNIRFCCQKIETFQALIAKLRSDLSILCQEKSKTSESSPFHKAFCVQIEATCQQISYASSTVRSLKQLKNAEIEKLEQFAEKSQITAFQPSF